MDLHKSRYDSQNDWLNEHHGALALEAFWINFCNLNYPSGCSFFLHVYAKIFLQNKTVTMNEPL